MITSTVMLRHAQRMLGCACMASMLVLPSAQVSAQPGPDRTGERWVASWGTAPAGPPPLADQLSLDNQTVRLIVHTSIGGTRVRVRLSNELGRTPLRIGAAHLALRASGAAIVPGSDRVLTFGGRAAITIAAGAPALSDPVALTVPALSDLAVSLHLPGPTQATTVHPLAFQTNYVSGPGNFTGAAAFPAVRTITSWPFLTEVDVVTPFLGATVVALGDSITDGVVTTLDANQRWPDFLARRLQSSRTNFDAPDGDAAEAQLIAPRQIGVVNRGISGNRLLRDFEGSTVGSAALARFDRDVLATAGVEYVIVLLGINDIGVGGLLPGEEVVSADDLIAGYRQLIARAHIRGLAIFGATLTPFEGSFPGYYTPEKERIRQAVNTWIRTSDEFDAVIDFDRAIRDPARPARMLPAFDSGDHLHPNDLGMEALGNAVPLELFRPYRLSRIRPALRN
ncbi:MAG: SGNH/GDSL hydrolase family protein [Pseudomonadota bacterium]